MWQAMALIQHFEGFAPEPYRCPGWFLTVGYGHRIYQGETWEFPMSQGVAQDLLQIDLLRIQGVVQRFIHIPLSSSQESALISFTFNVGGASLQRSTLRLKVNRQEHAEVPPALMQWVWSGGRKLPGLVRRRRMEGILYACGRIKGLC